MAEEAELVIMPEMLPNINIKEEINNEEENKRWKFNKGDNGDSVFGENVTLITPTLQINEIKRGRTKIGDDGTTVGPLIIRPPADFYKEIGSKTFASIFFFHYSLN